MPIYQYAIHSDYNTTQLHHTTIRAPFDNLPTGQTPSNINRLDARRSVSQIGLPKRAHLRPRPQRDKRLLIRPIMRSSRVEAAATERKPRQAYIKYSCNLMSMCCQYPMNNPVGYLSLSRSTQSVGRNHAWSISTVGVNYCRILYCMFRAYRGHLKGTKWCIGAVKTGNKELLRPLQWKPSSSYFPGGMSSAWMTGIMNP